MVVRTVVEEQVFEALDLVIQGLDGIKLPIDYKVEQPVQKCPDAVDRERRVLVEVSDQTINREIVVLANGDQCSRGDESRDLARDQFAAAHIKADCVRRQES